MDQELEPRITRHPWPGPLPQSSMQTQKRNLQWRQTPKLGMDSQNHTTTGRVRPCWGYRSEDVGENLSPKKLLASGLPDLQMTGLAEVHLSWINGLERWYLLSDEVFPDICWGSAKAIPDLSPWCQCTSCMGAWTKWSRVCGKGLIVSV